MKFILLKDFLYHSNGDISLTGIIYVRILPHILKSVLTKTFFMELSRREVIKLLGDGNN